MFVNRPPPPRTRAPIAALGHEMGGRDVLGTPRAWESPCWTCGCRAPAWLVSQRLLDVGEPAPKHSAQPAAELECSLLGRVRPGLAVNRMQRVPRA